MSLKKNSYRVLLWLLPTYNSPRQFSLQAVSFSLPETTQAGRLSLLYLLQRKGYISLLPTNSSWLVSLTALGYASLKTKFPAVFASHDQDNTKYLVTFLKAPKNDPSFRYLRTQLLEKHALQLSRGLYLFMERPDQALLDVTARLYAGAVLIVGLGEWIQGDEKQIIGYGKGLSDLFSAYSSISNQISRLLEKNSGKNGLNEADKKEVCSIYDRLFDLVSEDSGLVSRYYTQVESRTMMLEKLFELGTMG